MKKPSIKLLMIEDDPDDQLIMRDIISEQQAMAFDCVGVEQLETGVQYVGEAPVDVVLLDLSLPDSSGLETLTQMLESAPTTPIIIVTGTDDDEFAAKAVFCGAQEYLVKGQFDAGSLVRAIRYAIKRQAYLNARDRRYLEKLGQSKAQLQKIIDEHVDGIIVIDHCGLIQFVNPAAEELFRCNKERLIGRRFDYRLDPRELIEFEIFRDDGEAAIVEMRMVEFAWRDEPAYLASLRDITQRKRAEIALRHSESRYRGIFENSPVSLWEEDYSGVRQLIDQVKSEGVANFREYFDRHPDILRECARRAIVIDVNREGIELLAAPGKDDLLGPLSEIFRESSYAVFREQVIALAEGKREYETEAFNQQFNGDFRDVRLKMSIAPGSEDSWSKVIISIMDITDLKSAHRRIESMVASLKAILDATDELIGCPDLFAVYQRAVELARDKLGVERCAIFIREGDHVRGAFGTDLEGRTTDERALRLPMDDAWKQKFNRAGAGKRSWFVVNEPRTYWNGAKGVVTDEDWIAVTPIFSSNVKSTVSYEVFINDGAISGAELDETKQDILAVYCCIIGNIANRKRVEQRFSEQAALLDITRDAIIVQDLQGCIVYWNHAAEQLYGWTATEAVGKSFGGLVSQSTADNIGLTREALTRKEIWSGELKQNTKAGHEIIVNSRQTLMYDANRQPKSILIVNTDITEKKHFEEQLLRKQRLESLGTLASGIAHDLNNVLSPIMISIEILKRRGELPRNDRSTKLIEANLIRAANMVNQISTFARGAEGERLELDVRRLIHDIESMIKDSFPKNIRLTVDIADDLAMVNGNPTQLYQAVLNLCVNARDAMPAGGDLGIVAGNREIDEKTLDVGRLVQPGEYVYVRVSDGGGGIDPEIMDRIFEPFFTTKELGHGTGLGLATTIGIVKSHGGAVTVRSAPGEGAEFSIVLPAVRGGSEIT